MSTLTLSSRSTVTRRRAGCRAGQSRSRQHHRLDRHLRRHDRRLHGDPEHPDHQCLAAQHRGRHRHRRRQRLLDLDLLPDRRDRRHPADRLSQPRVLVPQDHARACDAVRAVLGRLCLHPRPAVDDRDARPAGLFRRRADPDGVHAGLHQAAEGASSRLGLRCSRSRSPSRPRSARPSAAISPRITAGRPSSSSTWCRPP